MTTITAEFSWGWQSLTSRPLRYIGAVLAVFFRLFMGLFFFAAGVNKVNKGWLWSDILKQVFEQRLTEIDPTSFATAFIVNFAMPLYIPTAYVVALGEVAAGASMLLGFASRWGGGLAFFIIFMLSIGGYYDASLIPLGLMALISAIVPSGRWFGLDRRFHRLHPDSKFF